MRNAYYTHFYEHKKAGLSSEIQPFRVKCQSSTFPNISFHSSGEYAVAIANMVTNAI